MSKILETANNAEAALLAYRWVGVVGWFFIMYFCWKAVPTLRAVQAWAESAAASSSIKEISK